MSRLRTNTPGEVARIHIRDGMSQTRRKLAALEKNYFNIDELSFEQLLTQLQDYANLARFNGIELDANELQPLLFASDEIIIMANILALDLADLEQQFQQRLHIEANATQWIASETTSLASPLGLALRLDSWLGRLRQPQSNAGENLYSLIESVIIGLSKELGDLFNNLFADAEQSQLFSRRFIQVIRQPHLINTLQTTSSNDVSVEDTQSLYASLLKAIDMVQQGSRTLLPESLVSQTHDPAASLRIVFVKLYQKLQARLNRFTLNFFDFYFTDVLQIQPRPLVPDSVHLVIQASLPEQEIYIAKGTEFSAGIDSKSQDIIYAAAADTLITDAKVTQLYSLFFPRALADGKTLLADGCWLDAINTFPDLTRQQHDALNTYPLFGAAMNGKASATSVEARLGFAIAHKILLLREGKRSVKLNLQYEKTSANAWSSLQGILQELPAAKSAGNHNNATFFIHFATLFEISITTADGWFVIPEYKPAYRETDDDIAANCLQISFQLSENAPPVTPYNAAIHGDAYESAVPILRFTLKENYVQYPYDILRHLVISEIRIAVDVEGCRDLVLHNNIGQLSPLAPFMPFGPLPEIGSYFIVGCEEASTKQLTSLDVDIEWNGLPTSAGGFADWYRGYHHVRNTHHFVASASVLTDGVWQPKSHHPGQYQPLFNTRLHNGQATLVAQKKLSCANAISYYKPRDYFPTHKALQYSPLTKSGLFKFTLQGPVGGFGHREYTTLLASTLTYNARIKQESLQRPLPNAPYTPEIASIRLHYSAESVLNLMDSASKNNPLMRDQFFHLHPLGWESMSPLRQPKIYQVPQYDDAGSLFIGIVASDCRQLSLLFHLLNNSLPMAAATPASTSDEINENDGYALAPSQRIQSPDRLHWSYLGDNQWHAIPAKNILSDSTHEFMTSGIVTLAIPPGMTTTNTIMPAGLCWLKVSARQQLNHFSTVYSVYAQALKATWQAGEHPATQREMVLPAGSITRTRQTIPGIAHIHQIAPSFDGVPAESIAHLRTRVSERLRHKNRGLTPLDYEMLILEKFPQVYKVKCFANVRTDNADASCGNHHSAICPGNLLIVPVPHLLLDRNHPYKPHFDGYLIQCIKEFVQGLAPAFVKISVENPVYEEIQVRCSVHLKKGYQFGYHHNVLNQALCEYLSPWNPVGNNVHFGWRVSEQEIKSFIHNLDFIAHVTDFSLLRITPKAEDLFTLDDSAAPPTNTMSDGKILPGYLWSTAVPIQQHYILPIDGDEQMTAEITGYDELEVGSTFIIS